MTAAADNSGHVPESILGDADSVRKLHEARVRTELTAAERHAPGSDMVAYSGALLPEVALVKGLPGPAESSGGAALSGPDGTAIASALTALGWPDESWFATLSRPEPSVSPDRRAARLRAQLEAVDPRVIIALDGAAAEDTARAFGVDHLRIGAVVRVLGRRLVALEGFEAALADETRKRRVWQQLHAAKPDGPIY